MVYTPHRTDRFEYVWELFKYIEKRQCCTCIHRNDDPEFPMCLDRAGAATAEEPVEDWRETRTGLVVCDAAVDESTGRQPTDEPLPLEGVES